MEKYNSFNARYLSFEQVAESFIFTNQFAEIARPEHSILMGPRGCGKTTILKMLHPRAIAIWNQANERKIEIEFNSVYIPADMHWRQQIDTFRRELDKTEDPEIDRLVRVVSQGLVNLNVLSSFVSALRDILRSELDPKSALTFEAVMTKELADVWELTKPIALNLYSVRKELSERLDGLNSLANAAKNGQLGIGEALRRMPTFCSHDYIAKISRACDAFDESVRQMDLQEVLKNRWALCFDELEISPNWLQEDLIKTKLRGLSDQRLIIKITTSPIIHDVFDSSAIKPSKDDDYHVVRNWVYDKQSEKEWFEFASELMNQRLKNSLRRDVRLNHIMGATNIVLSSEIPHGSKGIGSNRQDTEFDRNSEMYLLIFDLAKQDKSFYEYLVRKGVDPQDPVPNSRSQLDDVFRKIKPIVVFRHYFTKPNKRKGSTQKPGMTFRTRKKAKVYNGVDHLMLFTDGNPRAAINLISSLIPHIPIYENDSVGRIPIEKQAELFEQFSDSQFERILNFPGTTTEIDSKGHFNLAALLGEIGEAFKKGVYISAFKDEPALSFTVDESTPKQFIGLLRYALELGAIQYLTPNANMLKDSIYRANFRLSYFLFPKYSLPVRTSKPIQLSTLLRRFKNENQLTIDDEN